MSDLEFIKDVIYNLKMEYGSPATFTQTIEAVNLETGQRTVSSAVTKYVDRIIPLPLDRRNAFLKSVGIHSNELLVNRNDRQYLVETSDLGTLVVAEEDMLDVANNGGMRIKQIENFEYALILTATKAG